MLSALLDKRNAARLLTVPILVALAMLLTGVAAAAEPPPNKAWLGIEMQPSEKGGILIRHVFDGSPAKRVGILAGDVALRVDDVALENPQQLVDHIAKLPAGARIELLLQRRKRKLPKQIKLAPHPGLDYLFRQIHLGKKAPELRKLAAVRGWLPKRIKQLRGQVVLLDFWGSWCSACRALVPTLNEWQQRYRKQGLTVLGLSADPVAQADRTARLWKMQYLVATDVDQRTATAYRVRSIPAIYVVDRQGIIREVLLGKAAASSAKVEKLLQKLLAER